MLLSGSSPWHKHGVDRIIKTSLGRTLEITCSRNVSVGPVHIVLTSERPASSPQLKCSLIALTKPEKHRSIRCIDPMSSTWRLLDTVPLGLTTPIPHCLRVQVNESSFPQ